MFGIHRALSGDDDERKRPKKTREEWAEIDARHGDLLRRLREMIDRYRTINADRRRSEAGAKSL